VSLALALVIACTAGGLTLGGFAASLGVAVVGVPVAAYAALGQRSRITTAAALAAVAANLFVLGYWMYLLVDALEGVR
jgi:hypothetical protein